MAEDNQFHGKVAVITGGTQGLGEATARLLAARGAAGIVICGRNAERGWQIAEEIAGQGSPAEFVPADLAQLEDCTRVIEAADKSFRRIDVLVNCAGLTDRGTILDTSPALFDRLFAVNVRAPFFLMQGAAKVMIREGLGGAMVNILSMSSRGGQPFICAYSGSKGALAVLTRNVAFSLMRERIRVNGLNIGWTDTPGEHRIQRAAHHARPDWLEQAEREQPFGRLLKPDEVARAIAFLASDESGLMTGAIVDFDQSVAGCYETPPQPSPRRSAGHA
jgi:NAD(P)-dependent dehydrogenase (short-subunit alcohol dehydrogenase family)